MAPKLPPDSGGTQFVKIAGLAVIGLLVLCGLAGTCLLVVSFFMQQ